MKKYWFVLILVLIISLACNLSASMPEAAVPSDAPAGQLPSDTPQAISPLPSATPTPTDAAPPPPAEPAAAPASPVLTSAPEYVAYDFVAHICDAEWANSVHYITPCPSNLDESEQGYFTNTHLAFAESNTALEVPALIVLPQQGSTGTAIFGMYPLFEVWPGDQFRAALACQGDAACNVKYALEYFDAAGKYHAGSWEWAHQAGDGVVNIAVDLSALAGQSVRFVLAVRDADGNPADDFSLWMTPQIYRAPGAQPLAAGEDQPPGMISGWVNMADAPPYMTEAGTGAESMPVAVVFFNLADETYWWIHTSATGHPNFQMTLPSGGYHVVAYGQGVGDTPYVSAAYTGKWPLSCDQELKPVMVVPGKTVANIVIADWNWICGGDAYRPPKPADVPLP